MKKSEDASYKKYTFGGWLFNFVFPIIAISYGLYQSYKDDVETKAKTSKLEQQRTEDSTLLTHRWIYDTTKYKQLLDSSKEIIQNTNQGLLQSNKTLTKFNSTLQNIDKLKYPIEDNFRVSFQMRIYSDYYISILDSLQEAQMGKVFTPLLIPSQHAAEDYYPPALRQVIGMLKPNLENFIVSVTFWKPKTNTYLIGFRTMKDLSDYKFPKDGNYTYENYNGSPINFLFELRHDPKEKYLEVNVDDLRVPILGRSSLATSLLDLFNSEIRIWIPNFESVIAGYPPPPPQDARFLTKKRELVWLKVASGNLYFNFIDSTECKDGSFIGKIKNIRLQ